jgi:hypothetical protein
MILSFQHFLLSESIFSIIAPIFFCNSHRIISFPWLSLDAQNRCQHLSYRRNDLVHYTARSIASQRIHRRKPLFADSDRCFVARPTVRGKRCSACWPRTGEFWLVRTKSATTIQAARLRKKVENDEDLELETGFEEDMPVKKKREGDIMWRCLMFGKSDEVRE